MGMYYVLTDININCVFNMPQAQLFYFGFAHVRADNGRPEFQRSGVQTDPHPETKTRIKALLLIFPPFAHTFAHKPIDKLYTDSDCRV